MQAMLAIFIGLSVYGLTDLMAALCTKKCCIFPENEYNKPQKPEY